MFAMRISTMRPWICQQTSTSRSTLPAKSQPGVYGVAYRVTDDRGHCYVFWITQDGYWGVMNAQAGAVIASTKTSAIHQGYGVFNHMEVDSSGRHFTFFINGVRVGSANDGHVVALA